MKRIHETYKYVEKMFFLSKFSNGNSLFGIKAETEEIITIYRFPTAYEYLKHYWLGALIWLSMLLRN